MHLHRVIGGAQIFLVLLAAIALAEAWRELARRRQVAAAVAATGLLLYPMARERAQYLENNAAWGRRNLENYARGTSGDRFGDRPREATGRSGVCRPGGRLGRTIQSGRRPVLCLPQLGASSHRGVSVPRDGADRRHPGALQRSRPDPVPPLQHPVRDCARGRAAAVTRPACASAGWPFQVFDAPGGGYFDLVDVAAAVATNRRNFYDVNDRWLASGWPSRRTHLLLDWIGSAPAGGPRIAPDAPLPFLASGAPDPGSVSGSSRAARDYRAECDVLRPAYALFKMTWHPNWQAYVDGRPQPSVMLSPGFSGVAVAPGHHTVEFRYQARAVETGVGDRRTAAGSAPRNFPAHRRHSRSRDPATRFRAAARVLGRGNSRALTPGDGPSVRRRAFWRGMTRSNIFRE